MGILEILKGEQPGLLKSLLNYKDKGQFGEYLTEYALTNKNLPGSLKVFKNLYAPNNDRTTEVDLLMLHEKGMFVFESKNYSGWIFGNSENDYWIQTLPRGIKNRFFNPIKQNKIHIKALANTLSEPASAFLSCIVFSDRCELKNLSVNDEEVIIVNRQALLKEMRKELARRSVIYDEHKMALLAGKLEKLTNISNEEKEAHVNKINERHSSDICPICGETLVRRNGRFGAFIGCSGYPKCRYTREFK